MNQLQRMLVSSTAIGAALAVGVVGLGLAPLAPPWANEAQAQRPCGPANPCAAKAPCGAANPCAAKNPCNPCAAANPCNPCGAAAAAYSKSCTVPRLVRAAKANPCAAKNPCGPAARAANPCNPCAAKASPCNPCAARANPCAARANPFNPCAATANPCNPCNPCAAGGPVELTDAEARAAGDCMRSEMKAAYARSPLGVAKAYASWPKYSTQSYLSATHGQRYVGNYANAKARAYGRYEKAGKLPVGAQLAKDSFLVGPDGRITVGPLFLMEKMPSGFLAASGDWKYTMIMPDGSLFGQTKGRNSAGMAFCIACHQAAAEHDHVMFLPEPYRVRR